jgi:hypothetical protein
MHPSPESINSRHLMLKDTAQLPKTRRRSPFAAMSGPVWFLALAILLCGWRTVHAQSPGEDFDTRAFAGGVAITGYKGAATEVSIPLAIGGQTVLRIDDGAFQNESGITSLLLPTSLQEIGDDAFRGCAGISSIFLPESVNAVGLGAFADCERLVSIVVDSNNINYESNDGVLYDVSTGNAELLQFPANRDTTFFELPAATTNGLIVTSIAEFAFDGVRNLLAVEIAGNVTEIKEFAFANAERLARVLLGAGVTSVGNSAFSGIGTLTSATFHGNAPVPFGTGVFDGAAQGFEVRFIAGSDMTAPTWEGYSSRIVNQLGDFLYQVNGSTVTILGLAPGAGASLTIPSLIDGLSVRTIASQAFTGDTGITDIELPGTLTTIGDEAFYACSGLTDVGPLGTVFPGAGLLEIPANVTSIGVAAFGACPLLLQIEVSSNNPNYSARDNVLFNKSQTSIIQYPVSGPSTYEVPTSVKTIASRAFEANQNLVTIEFGVGVTTIGRQAFLNNESLISVRFGRSISTIDDEAFASNRGALSSALFFGDAPATFGSNVFGGATSGFEVLYLGGATGFSNPWNGYPTATLQEEQNFEFIATNGTVEVFAFTGTPPGPGDVAQITPDLTTRPAPDFSGGSNSLEFALYPGPGANFTPIPNYLTLPVGFLFHDLERNLIWQFEGYDENQGVQVGWNWVVFNTNNARLQLDQNVSPGTTVIEQNDSGAIIYQKIANPGSNPSDWIEVDFEIPKTIAGLPVTSIGPGAFANNTLLRSVVIPATVTRIGANAFDGCTQLGVYNQQNAIFLPAALSQIGQDAFLGCESLQNLFVHELNPVYTADDGVLMNKERTQLVQYPPGKSGITYSIPSTIQQILPRAFRGNRFLAAISLPDSVTTIGDDAFRSSASLVQVTIGNAISSIGNNAFRDSVALGSVIFTGNAPTSIGTNMFDGTAPVSIQYYNGFSGFTPTPPNWSSYTLAPLSSIDEFVFAIEGTAPNQTATVTGYKGTGGAITIPERFGQLAVRKIGDNAFLGKVGITSVIIPNSVSSIGEAAFKGVSTLASVSFGSGLTSIGKEAFYGCNELTEVAVSAAITDIGEAAFAACEKLIAIKVDPNNSNYRSTSYLNGAGQVLFDRTQKTLVQYPAGIQQPNYEIPVTVETIGKRAFEGAVYLSVIEFPASVEKIETRAFFNTAALVTVIFGRGIATIEDEAFAGIITPLNAAIFYGDAPTSFGGNVFQGALPTFEVRYLEGAAGFPPGAGGVWNTYNAVAIMEISEFEFRLVDNNTKVEITGYTGLLPTITADINTLPSPQIVVSNQAERFDLSGDASVAVGSLVLQRDNLTLYVKTGQRFDRPPELFWPPEPFWRVFDNSGARFSLPSALPLGTVVLEQNGVSKVYYQKIGDPGVATSNWIVVDFRIPDTISDLPVTSIAAGAFENNPLIQSVVLPNSLTRIGAKAFAGCTRLGGLISGSTKGGVFLPASVTTHGDGAFASCGMLQQIIAHPSNQVYSSSDGILFNERGTQVIQFPAGLANTTYIFPEAVTDIADSAFEGNVYLAELEFPSRIRTIGTEAFYGSQTLVRVIFGTGLTSLGDNAFAAIPSLGEAIFFGDAPSNVGTDVFQGAAEDFKVLYVSGAEGFPPDSSGTWVGYPAQAITAFDDFEFQVVPDGAEILGYLGNVSQLFFEPDLTTLPPPDEAVTNQAARLALPAGLPIGWNVLELSTNLIWFVESQTRATANTPAQNNWAVRVTAGDRLLLDTTVPIGTTFKEQSATAPLFYQKVAMPGTNESDWIRISRRTLQIPETIANLPVVSIADEAFLETSSLESVVFPNSLERIGDFAFAGCSELGLPDKFAGSGRGVFIPVSVNSIGTGAFASCSSLPAILVHPNNGFFEAVGGVLLNESLTTLLQYPTGLFDSSYTIPSTVGQIAESAFEGSRYLTEVTISDQVESIGAAAFRGSASLAKVVLGEGLKSIGDEAFALSSPLTSVRFQGNAPVIGTNLFDGASNQLVVRYLPGASGFGGSSWVGIPLKAVALWSPAEFQTTNGFLATGVVDPGAMNGNLGGQLTLRVTRSGVGSGMIVMGAADGGRGVYARFRGSFNEDGVLEATIPRRGESALQVVLQLDLLEAPDFFRLEPGLSYLTDGTEVVALEAAMVPWSRVEPATGYAGNYNVGLVTDPADLALVAPSGRPLVSQGYGILQLSVRDGTGAVRLAGTLADGSRVSASSVVQKDGGIPIWNQLYSRQGVLVGDLGIDSSTDGRPVDALLYWTKPSDVKRLPDEGGFANVLITAANGSGLFEPEKIVLPQPPGNLELTFGEGNWAGDAGGLPGGGFTQDFSVTHGGRRIMADNPNPARVRASWNLRSGLMRGTFTAYDLGGMARRVRFQAALLTAGDDLSILGNYVMPDTARSPSYFIGGSVVGGVPAN